MRRSSHVDGLISAHLNKIVRHYGRVTSCMIAIRAPGAHHKMGEPFAVSIRIGLPGRRVVNVRRISNSQDRRQADIVFAINDAFRRAMRQLNDKIHKSRADEVPSRRLRAR